MIQNTPPRQFLTPNEFESNQNLIKSSSTTEYIPIPITAPLFDYSLASAGRQIHSLADIYIRRRKHSLAQKSGRQFFWINVREIRTGFQDNTED